MSNERSTKGDATRAPQTPAERTAAETAAATAATDAAKARQVEGDTKHGRQDEPGAGNSRIGVDGLPIR